MLGRYPFMHVQEARLPRPGRRPPPQPRPLIDRKAFAKALKSAQSYREISNEELGEELVALGVSASADIVGSWRRADRPNGRLPSLEQLAALFVALRPRRGLTEFRDAFDPEVWRAIQGSTDA